MMQCFKYWQTAVATSAIVLCAGALVPQVQAERKPTELRTGPGQHMELEERPRGRMGHALFRDMDLTVTQREQMREIHDNARKAQNQWREQHAQQIAAARGEMRKAAQNGDREGMQAARDKMQKLAASRPNAEDHINKVREVLTDEQREKFDQRQAAIREQVEQRRTQQRERVENARQQRGNQADRGQRGNRGQAASDNKSDKADNAKDRAKDAKDKGKSKADEAKDRAKDGKDKKSE